MQEGPASQSYGLQVAQLAGVPAAVIRAARKHLTVLENQSSQGTDQFDLFAIKNETAEPASTPSDPTLTALHELDPDTLSPREALEALYHLKKLSTQG